MTILPEDKGPTFEPTTHWCPKHLEPFRENWPSGWALATMGIFEVCLRRDDIIEAAGHDTRMLDRVLREFSPLCCLVGNEETAKWTALSLGPLETYRKELEDARRT